ncbi:MAG TPA: alpha/beta fold hydrolase [Candidatus Eremiobacteraceae bacterium]|nr:alpha/beta fold hydrolase [Candidatus Eremiobacteraceae bacterium]
MRFLCLSALAAGLVMIQSPTLARADQAPSVGTARPVPDAVMHAGELRVEKFGSGDPALVLIPGLASGSWVWDSAIRHFSSKHAIYAVTLPGFDGTTPISAPLLDKADASLLTLIQSEHLVRPVLVGHSIGGFLAIRFAEEHAAQLGGIVSIDGLPVFPPMAQMSADARAAAADKFAAKIRKQTAEQFAAQQRTTIAAMVTDQSAASAVAALTSKSDPAATGEYVDEMLRADLRPALAKDTTATLVLAPIPQKAGPDYPRFMQTMTPAQLGATVVQFYTGLLTGAPHVTVVPIANSLHFATIDQPAKVNDAIDEFLVKNVSGTFNDEPRHDQPLHLDSVRWQLAVLSGKTVTPPSEALRPALVFGAAEKRVTGSGGCNQISGSYKVTGDKLHFGPMTSTLMACAHGMDTETAFLSALINVNSYQIVGYSLYLYDKSNRLAAVLRAEK